MSRRARTFGILSDKFPFVELYLRREKSVEAGHADGSSALSAQREYGRFKGNLSAYRRWRTGRPRSQHHAAVTIGGWALGVFIRKLRRLEATTSSERPEAA